MMPQHLFIPLGVTFHIDGLTDSLEPHKEEDRLQFPLISCRGARPVTLDPTQAGCLTSRGSQHHAAFTHAHPGQKQGRASLNQNPTKAIMVAFLDPHVRPA